MNKSPATTTTINAANIMAYNIALNLRTIKLDITLQPLITFNPLLIPCPRLNGTYPNGETRGWESTEMVRSRVLKCLEKYKAYNCVVVSGHAMMMQAVFGINEPIEYGAIMELVL